MEVTGLVFRPTQFSQTLFSGYSSINGLNRGLCNISVKPRNQCGVAVSGFSDDGHLKYYESTRREVKRNNNLVVEEKTEKKKIKKKLKYLKGLSKNMLMFPEMVLDDNSDGLVQDDVRNTISEATTILLGQLKQLKAEKKQQKRKRKEEKQKLRAAQMKTTREGNNSSSLSSSSSSESSNDEAKMVVNMSRLRRSAMAESQTRTEEKPLSSSIQAQPETPIETFLCQSQLSSEPKIQVRVEALHEQHCCSTSGGISGCGDVKAERIDVCVGGKCRKMGGAALLEEFERAVGMKGSVVGCKCMGKCRSGPNVKVHASQDKDGLQGGNPLYIGVGLEDVGAIVSRIFGEKRCDLGLVTS
ncbi:hypothetical protein Sjap_007139 [Stephania japonica]|uniref:Uncharacterized protein n=1 Tax=Stephania japonica TaxID=461633 RepID=A0AAP0JP87_9MAGN